MPNGEAVLLLSANSWSPQSYLVHVTHTSDLVMLALDSERRDSTTIKGSDYFKQKYSATRQLGNPRG